ncbi:MAG: Caspase domain protein [Bacteroidetes bacterium]|nr:MAG: Caspase domain protein [Bacteroidota bacterium]
MAISKKAIIIAAPLTSRKQGYAPGVHVDAVNWRNYFLSATGGGFYEWEIITLINPTLQELIGALRSEWTDYATVVFSGHGSFSKKASSTMLMINTSGQQIALSSLMGYSSKELFIVNCCRNIQRDNFIGFLGDPQPEYMLFPSRITRAEGRRLHESKLEELPDGREVIFSAKIGESSWTGPKGSDFCNAILSMARNWATFYEPKSFLMINGARKYAEYWLRKNIGKKQTPEIQQTSPRPNFPFAMRYGEEIDTRWPVRNVYGWQRRVKVYA